MVKIAKGLAFLIVSAILIILAGLPEPADPDTSTDKNLDIINGRAQINFVASRKKSSLHNPRCVISLEMASDRLFIRKLFRGNRELAIKMLSERTTDAVLVDDSGNKITNLFTRLSLECRDSVSRKLIKTRLNRLSLNQQNLKSSSRINRFFNYSLKDIEVKAGSNISLYFEPDLQAFRMKLISASPTPTELTSISVSSWNGCTALTQDSCSLTVTADAGVTAQITSRKRKTRTATPTAVFTAAPTRTALPTLTAQILPTATRSPTAVQTATPVSLSPSSSGATVSDLNSFIVDANGGIWKLGGADVAGGKIVLLNGFQAGNGGGILIYWNGLDIFVKNSFNNWYKWTGSNQTWSSVFSPIATPTGTALPSPSPTLLNQGSSLAGTIIPDNSSLIRDSNGNSWTIGSNNIAGGKEILLNGSNQLAGYGGGIKIYWDGRSIYVLNSYGQWYLWSGAWQLTTQPAGSVVATPAATATALSTVAPVHTPTPYPSSSATKFYIRDGATGTTCTDWGANACDSLPQDLQRGAIYYIADGYYNGYHFDDEAQNSQLITIRKATVADFGDSVGWQNSYGDGTAVFSGGLIFSTPFYELDGRQGGGPGSWKSGFGFKVEVKAAASGPGIKNSAPFISVRHIEIEGNGGDGDGSGADNDLFWIGAGNFEASHFYAHRSGRCIVFSNTGVSNVMFRYGYTGRHESTSNQHSEIASIWGTVTKPAAWKFYHMIFTHSEGTGGLMFEGDNLEVYGSIFAALDGNYLGGGNGLIGTWSNSAATNLRIYNNTFVGSGLPAVGIFDGIYSGDFRNNLVYNGKVGTEFWVGSLPPGSPLANSFNDTHNHYINAAGYPSGITDQIGSADPFISISAGNFAPRVNSLPGINLGSQYNTDMFGKERRTWTRGAIEF